jgi:hypothetical protein
MHSWFNHCVIVAPNPPLSVALHQRIRPLLIVFLQRANSSGGNAPVNKALASTCKQAGVVAAPRDVMTR